MTAIANILEEFLNTLMGEMKAHLKNASGTTASLFQVIVTTESEGALSKVIGQLITPSYIEVLERGRPPTSANAKKGNPTLQQILLEWIQSGNITPVNRFINRKPITQVQLSWAMAIKIHNEGTLLYRTGGKSGIISQVITAARLDAFVQVFGTKASKIMLNEIKQTIFR